MSKRKQLNRKIKTKELALSAAGSAPRVSTRTPHKSRSNATNAITDEMREDYVGEGVGKQSGMDKYCDHVSEYENNCSPCKKKIINKMIFIHSGMLNI